AASARRHGQGTECRRGDRDRPFHGRSLHLDPKFHSVNLYCRRVTPVSGVLPHGESPAARPGHFSPLVSMLAIRPPAGPIPQEKLKKPPAGRMCVDPTIAPESQAREKRFEV